MKAGSPPLRSLLSALSLACWLAALALPASAAPRLSYIYPAGGQRGTTVKVSFNGSELAGIAGFYTTGSGLTAKLEPGGEAGSRTVDISIASDAPLDIQQVRLYDRTGLSNPKFFCVGQYPETLEKEPNDTQQDALKVTLPITINGRIQQYSDVDAVTFHARPDETVVSEIQALRILGEINDSWLKGYMEIRDAEGHVLAENNGTDDDYYRWDPLIAFTPPKEGDYTVFYRDLNWRGAPMAVYRLTIGVVPHALGIFPLGGQRGKTVDVHFYGSNLTDATQRLPIPAEAPDELQVAFTGPNGTTNARPFQVSDLPDALQNTANHTRETAQTVPFPCTVSGRIEKDGMHDFYRFHLDKPQKVVLEVFSRRIGTPMDSELALYDAAGKQLQTNDDAQGRDSRLQRDLSPGDYTVAVRDIDDRGGPAFSYRLAISLPRPHFRLLATPDAPVLARNGKVTLKVHIDREDGFGGDVTLHASGLPHGVTAEPLTLPKDKQEGQFTLTATGDAPPGPIRLEIVGTGKAGEQSLQAIAHTTETYNIQGTAYQRDLLGPILLITEK